MVFYTAYRERVVGDTSMGRAEYAYDIGIDLSNPQHIRLAELVWCLSIPWGYAYTPPQIILCAPFHNVPLILTINQKDNPDLQLLSSRNHNLQGTTLNLRRDIWGQPQYPYDKIWWHICSHKQECKLNQRVVHNGYWPIASADLDSTWDTICFRFGMKNNIFTDLPLYGAMQFFIDCSGHAAFFQRKPL